jgi:NifB/MoaA-like Fe-S oxidoreductase
MTKVYSIAKPKGVNERLWIVFINERCSNCNQPKNGCSDEYATLKQAVKCFKDWLNKVKEK